MMCSILKGHLVLQGAPRCSKVLQLDPDFDPGCRWPPLSAAERCWMPLGTFVLILQLVAGNHAQSSICSWGTRIIWGP